MTPEELNKQHKYNTKYPEHAKLRTWKRELTTLFRFLGYLDEHADDYCIAQWSSSFHEHRGLSGKERDAVVYTYIGIDPDKLEAERRAMVESFEVSLDGEIKPA